MFGLFEADQNLRTDLLGNQEKVNRKKTSLLLLVLVPRCSSHQQTPDDPMSVTIYVIAHNRKERIYRPGWGTKEPSGFLRLRFSLKFSLLGTEKIISPHGTIVNIGIFMI